MTQYENPQKPISEINENVRNYYINTIDQRRKAKLWKAQHYDASRHYNDLDRNLTLAALIIAVLFLACALLTFVDDLPVALKIIFFVSSLVQGFILVSQLALQPSALADSYRTSARRISEINRDWVALQLYIESSSSEEIAVKTRFEALLEKQNAITNEAREIPSFLVKRSGVVPQKENDEITN